MGSLSQTTDSKYQGFSERHDLSAFSLSFPDSACTADENAFTVDDFTLSAPNQQLFTNASFKIVKGHRYGVLGPNGHGKTTLIRHIAARVFPLPSTWDVLLVEQEARSSDRSVLEEVLSADVEAVQLLAEEQALLAKLEDETITVEELEETQQRLERVIEDMNIREVSKQESRCRRILNGLGFIGPSQERPISSFSGGWRMRVNLAKALFIQPKLLMLDEPTNHLDLDAVLWLEKYLASEYPHTVVLISHDAEFLDAVVTDIWYVKDKKVNAYRGGFTEFEKMREQQLNKHAKEYDQYERAMRSAKTKDDKERVTKKYQELMGGAITKPLEYKVKFSLTEAGRQSKASTAGIGLSEVSFSYTGTKPYVVERVDFGLDASSRVALVGPNGAGKSTVLKLLTGELMPVEGVINKNPQLRVEMFSQHFEEGLDLTVTAADLLMRTAEQFKNETCTSIEKARGILGRYGLSSEHHTKLVGSLSGGQKARVAFAALGLRQPHILILDEPTNHLDIETVEALTLALKSFAGGVLLVSHDARLINEVECKLYVCKARKVVALEGDFEDYRKIVLDEIAEREAEAERINSLDREKKRELYAAKLGKERFESVLNQGEIAAAAPAASVKAPTLDVAGLVFGPKKKAASKKP